MVSRNNRIKRMEQNAECQAHFGIRKLTIGAASVLLGTTLWLGNNSNVAKADVDANKGDIDKASEEAASSIQSGAASAKKSVIIANNSDKNASQSVTDNADKTTDSQKITIDSQNKSQDLSQSQENNQELDNSQEKNIQKQDSDKDKANIQGQEANKNQTSKDTTLSQADSKTANASQAKTTDKDEVARRDFARKTQLQQAKENTVDVQVINDTKNNTSFASSLTQAAQKGKKVENKEKQSTQLNLFDTGLQGVQSQKDKLKAGLDKDTIVQKENLSKLNSAKEDALDANKIKQLSNLSAQQVAQLYGTSLVQANSIKNIFDQLKGLNLGQLKDSIGKITATVKDPAVQKLVKDITSGNAAAAVVDGLKAKDKIKDALDGVKNIAGQVSGNSSDGQNNAVSGILDKLKDFKIPSITKIKPAIDGITTIMKDPGVKDVISDIKAGKIGDALTTGSAVLPTIEHNLAPLNDIVKDATGVDVMDQVKSKLPNVNPQDLSNAFNGITSTIQDPSVQKLVKDITSGNYTGLIGDVGAIPKIVNGFKPVGNLVKELIPNKGGSDTPKPDEGHKTSWFDKLKNLMPSFTDEEMTAAKNAINRVVSDQLVKNVVTDVITQNYPKLLIDVIHYGPTTLKNAKASIEEITKAIKDAKAQKLQNKTFTYTINYMDGKNKVGSQEVSGKPSTTAAIEMKLPDGYVLAPGSTVPGSYTFTTKNESINVTVVKNSEVKPVDPNSTTYTYTINYKDGNETVSSQPIHGKTGETKTITIQVPAGYKIVNGTQIPGAYTFNGKDDSIDIPVAKESSENPDNPQINPDNPNKNPDNPQTNPDNPNRNPDNPQTNPDKPDTTQSTQQAKLIIIDQDDNENPIKVNGIDTEFNANGKSGEAIKFGNTLTSISALEKLGYVYVSNDIPTDAKFDNESDSDKVSQIYQIIMRHGVQAVTADTNIKDMSDKAVKVIQPDKLTKQVNLNVVYKNSDKSAFTGQIPANAKQTITFNGTAYIDKVTGSLVNARKDGDNLVIDQDNRAIPEITWKADKPAFAAVISPEEKGYQVVDVSDYKDGNNVAAINDVLKDRGVINVTVMYAPDSSKPSETKQGSIVVKVFDKSTNQLMNNYGFTTGKVAEGTAVNFTDYDKQIQDLISQRYKLVSDPISDGSLPAKVADADLNYRIIVEHRIIPVDLNNPAIPGQLIATGNADHKYPSDTDIKNLEHTVTRTITYEGLPDSEKVNPVSDSLKFTAQGYIDAVSGKWTTQDGKELQNQADHYTWSAQNGTKFASVASPYSKNYHITKITDQYGNDYGDVKEIDNIDQNSKDINIIVNYAPNGKLVPVDQNDQVISSAPSIQYVTNPVDLYKVMPQNAPTIAGYTTNVGTVTPASPDIDTSVKYTAIPVKVKKGRVIVTVHDNTAAIDLSDYSYDSKRRKVGTKVDFNKDQVISSLEQAGYKVINPNVVIPNKVTKGKHLVTIYVEHDIIPVTEENNPTKEVLTKTATQTVHYQGAGQATPKDNVSTITFTHKLSLDRVTNKVIDEGWSPASQSYKTIFTPNIEGYTAKMSAVGGDTINVNDSDLNREYTVDYTKNPVLTQVSVTYTDDVSGNVLERVNILGNVGDAIKYDPEARIAYYEGNGYKLVSNDLTNNSTFNEENNNYNIVLTHTTSKLDSNHLAAGYAKDDLEKTVTRVVEYNYADNSKTVAPIKQTVNFQAHGTIDNVTGQLVNLENGKIIPNGKLIWSASQASFAAIPGLDLGDYYISGIKEVNTTANIDKNGQIAAEQVNPASSNSVIALTLTKKNTPVKAAISVSVYDLTDKKTLPEYTVTTGQVDEGSKFNFDKAGVITDLENKGYVIVTPKVVIPDEVGNTDQNIVLYVQHATADKSETKTATQTVHYQGAGKETPKDDVSTITLHHNWTIDKVTGKTVKDNGWSQAAFPTVVTPNLENYTADKPSVGGSAINADKGNLDQVYNVVYTRNKATGRVTYLDSVTGAILETAKIAGNIGDKIGYNPEAKIAYYEGKGYKLVSNDLDNKEFTKSGNDYNIVLTHTTSKLDQDHLAGNFTKNDLNKSISRVVEYVYADGSKSVAPVKQTVNFQAHGTVDNVTGQLVTVKNDEIIPNGQLTWTASKKASYDAIPALDLGDYYVSHVKENNSNATIDDNSQISAEKVSQDSPNSSIVLTLTKKAPVETTGKVTYYDNTDNNVLETATLNGAVGQKINYTTSDKVQAYLNKGFKLVSNNFNDGKQEFDKDSKANSFAIHLVHTTTPVTDKKTVTRTINYIYADGSQALSPVVQTVDFTGKGVKDKVTGNLVNLNDDSTIKDQNGQMKWTSENAEFAAVPGVDNAKFTVSMIKQDKTDAAVNSENGQVAAEQVTPTMNNATIDIVLNKVAIPEKGSITVTVHDNTANKDLTDYTKSSGEENVGTSFDYDLAGKILDLENKGYKVINKDIKLPDKISNSKQNFVINIEHDVATIDPDKEISGAINPNSSSSPQWPKKSEYSKSYTSTIHFVDENGNQLAQDSVQTSTWTRKLKVDKVTGEILNKDAAWTPNISSYAEVTVPVINGYTAAGATKNGVNISKTIPSLKASQNNLEDTVVYTKDHAKTSDSNVNPAPNNNNSSVDNSDSTTNTSITSDSSAASNAETPQSSSQSGTDAEANTTSNNNEGSGDSSSASSTSNIDDSVNNSDNSSVDNSDASDDNTGSNDLDDSDNYDEDDNSESNDDDNTTASSTSTRQTTGVKNTSTKFNNSFAPHSQRGNGINVGANAESVSDHLKSSSMTKEKTLPQTGEASTQGAAAAILGATTALSMIGLAGIKKRRRR